MKTIVNFVREKGWLVRGSCIGGAIGALAIHFNEALPHTGGLSFGLPMGPALAVALGMIGGMIGGVIGSFIAGMSAREDVALNVGESLGIGLLNGFVVGTAVGIAVGVIGKYRQGAVTPTRLFVAMAVLAVAAFFLMRRGRSAGPRGQL
ncbi:MAG: hypothetical protein JXA24_04070 [Proteobacteria bacterium]|nr:hypothetical protein [Pseudomonadota bacterium]